jgi:hypothetical protein
LFKHIIIILMHLSHLHLFNYLGHPNWGLWKRCVEHNIALFFFVASVQNCFCSWRLRRCIHRYTWAFMYSLMCPVLYDISRNLNMEVLKLSGFKFDENLFGSAGIDTRRRWPVIVDKFLLWTHPKRPIQYDTVHVQETV